MIMKLKIYRCYFGGVKMRNGGVKYKKSGGVKQYIT